jgi:hypothetical protein
MSFIPRRHAANTSMVRLWFRSRARGATRKQADGDRQRIGINRPGCAQAVSVFCFESATWQAPQVVRGKPIPGRNEVITHEVESAGPG